MAECHCGTCEHCRAEMVTIGVIGEMPWSPPPDEPLRGVKPRRLISRTEMADIRASWLNECPAFARLLDGYEVAVHLLEEVVTREPIDPTRPVSPMDVAWLKLREAER